MNKRNDMKSYTMIYRSVVTIIIVIAIIAIRYPAPIDISYTYDGIKYQSGNLDGVEIVQIEIQGEYRRRIFSEYSEFEGVIKVGDKIFSKTPFVFNKYGRDSLETNNEFWGMIFQSDEFQILTIEIWEKHVSGEGHYFDGNNGWYISAPCQTRDEAVKISNMVLWKMKGDTHPIE